MRQTLNMTITILVAMAAGYLGGLMSQANHTATAAGAAQPAVQEVVRTKRLELVDDTGKVRGAFSLRDDGAPYLALRDAAGKRRGTLGLLDDGTPRLELYDAGGKGREFLGLRDDGTPYLVLRDAAGELRGSLGLNDDGSPSFALRDAAGKTRTVLGSSSQVVTATGETINRAESSLVFYDKDEKVLQTLP